MKNTKPILKGDLLANTFNVLNAVSEDDYNALSHQAQGNLIIMAVDYLVAVKAKNPKRVFSKRSKFWSMP